MNTEDDELGVLRGLSRKINKKKFVKMTLDDGKTKLRKELILYKYIIYVLRHIVHGDLVILKICVEWVPSARAHNPDNAQSYESIKAMSKVYKLAFGIREASMHFLN